MWTIFAIALAAMVVALVLAYLLKSRLSDDDVWQELVDPNAPAEDSESSVRSDEVSLARADEFPRTGVQPMHLPNSSSLSSREADLRRSSRVENPVPLVVLGTNRSGETFQERTSAVSFNLHGCRYSSRHEYQPESWVTLQVTGTDGAAAPPVRARVRSVLSAQSSRELCQVGVEFESPANIWGIATPPEDWERLLGSSDFGSRAATAAAPAVDPAAPSAEYVQRTSPPAVDRRAEVAVFPSPVAQEAPATSKESPTPKPERVTFTPEQLLQALQGKLQLAAERAVETALTNRLEETVKQALSKIEEGWKANVRQTEEFSAARLAEVQSRWERELVVYRSRAEEISRRVETLATSSRQGLVELQKFAEHIKTEVEPQLNARLDESTTRASADLENKAGELAERHKAKMTEFAQFAARQARAQLEESVTEARALVSSAKTLSASGVSGEQLASLMNSSREATLNGMEERVAEIRSQFEQQHDLVRRRSDEIAQHLETLSTQLNEAREQHEQELAEVRTTLANVDVNSSPERFDAALKLAEEQIFNHLEWRLGEVSGRADKQHNAVLQRSDELVQRMDELVTDSANTRLQAERSAAELRGLLATANSGVSQQHLDEILNSVREQLINHLEWRLGEISGEFQQQRDADQVNSEEMSRRLEAFAADLRAQLAETRSNTESLIHEMRPNDLASIEHSVDRAAREFEVSAARISDRQLVRLMQQKQVLSTETSLELEARASETRALLQKAANTTLDDFHQRIEAQIELVMTETTERLTSSLASLDAESRAACEARRHEVEAHVARAAEQSTAEFRSGIKAFLYSCLVAAVSAVDEHAQSTLAGLGKHPGGEQPAIEASSETENRSSTNGVSNRSTDPPFKR